MRSRARTSTRARIVVKSHVGTTDRMITRARIDLLTTCMDASSARMATKARMGCNIKKSTKRHP